MRWELMTDHYIDTDQKCEWEHNETDLQTGRALRKRYPVPTYLDKGTIVCQAGKGQRGDVTILGDPTPDMMPLDDEARDLSATFEGRWAYKPDTAEIPYSQSVNNTLADKFAPVEVKGLEELVVAVGAMAKQNQEVLSELSKRRL